MTDHRTMRRRVIAGLAGTLGAQTGVARAAAALATPSAAEGPFYPLPKMRRVDIDNDLVKIAGQVTAAGGEVILLKGQVTDGVGTPRAGLRVEIWQCDVNGNYMHPADQRSANFDPAFQGFGHDITDDLGNYVFRTIKPTSYPGRTPHIHVKVLDGSRALLTTQFYIKSDPSNRRDVLYKRMSTVEAEAVSMTFIDGPDGPETTVNIVL